MPGQNRQGPEGKGPMSGGRRGLCDQDNTASQPDLETGPGTGQRMGLGRGLGNRGQAMRNRGGKGRGTGRGRGGNR